MTKPTMWLCAQRSLRSAHSCAHSHFVGFVMSNSVAVRSAKSQISPQLGAQSLCWFCHVAAQFFFSYTWMFMNSENTRRQNSDTVIVLIFRTDRSVETV